MWTPVSSILMSTPPYFSLSSLSFAAFAAFAAFDSDFSGSSELILNLIEKGGISPRMPIPIEQYRKQEKLLPRDADEPFGIALEPGRRGAEKRSQPLLGRMGWGAAGSAALTGR
jgi:hypothetical protein